MGNIHIHKHLSKHKEAAPNLFPDEIPTPTNPSASILKLFEKLELTADEGNTHPGEMSRRTFENAFQGPLHKFGKLMYSKMLNGRGDRDRITREEFVAAGTEIITMLNIGDQRFYYFKLFAGNKEYLTKDDAFQMVMISYILMISVSKVTYCHDERDKQMYEGMVTSMFGIEDRLRWPDAEKWLLANCPCMFMGVHNWVCMVLNGSNLPAEMEARTAQVPQLENFTCGEHCLSLCMAWALAAVLPNLYTRMSPPRPVASTSNQKDPMLQSFSSQLISMNWIPRVQSWNILYSSDRDGLSKNRFSHHIGAYHGPVLILFSFEGRNHYCLALDCALRDGITKIGGQDCRLIQLLPVYRLLQSGPNMVQWNSMSRNIPKGLQVGQDGKATVLRVDEDFTTLYHYDVPCQLHRIEVWGCGGEEVKKAQLKQKQWEAKDTERQRTRKLRLEGDNWRENPDKQILEWGGVRTGSSYLANR